MILTTLFADFTSPASYLTEMLLWTRAEGGRIEVRYRACTHLPHLPGGVDEACRTQAEALGVILSPPALVPSTQKAQEAGLFAREHGREEPMRQALYRAFWSEGRDIGRIDVLQALAVEVGLDEFDAKVALDLDRYREDVLRDEAIARRLGIVRPPVLYVGTGPSAGVLVGLATEGTLDAALGRELSAG